MRHEAMAAGASGIGFDAELIRAEAGGCSGPRRPIGASAALVVVEGSGAALAGDVWLEVGPGDRLEVDPGEPCAVRAGESGPIVAVLVGRAASGLAA